MTEWVAIFRESGLRDDVTIANLQDACLKLVVLARARPRELQVDQQVERAQQPLSAKTAIPTTKPKCRGPSETDKPVCRFFLKPDGCKNGDNCQYAHPRTNGKCLRCGSESHNLQASTTVFSLLDLAVRSQHLASPMLSLKEEQLMSRLPIKETRRRRKLRASLKAKDSRLSLQPRVVTSALTRMPRLSKKNMKNLKSKTKLKKMIQKLIL